VDVEGEHPGGQHEINALHMPTGQPVQLTMISQDVFHSFSIPAFRVKREAIPGRYTTVWFEATTPGTYHLFCTQYCGTNHSQMIGDHRDDARRLQEVAGQLHQRQLAGAERRAALRQPELQCLPQHNADARGPSLAGVYGSKLTLSNGSDHHRRRRLSARGHPESRRSTSRRAMRPSCPPTRARSAKKA
jgi:cytochrome c oxidase subunit II